MKRSSPPSSSSHSSPRQGNTLLLVIAALVVIAVAALLAWWFLGRSAGDGTPQVLINRVSKGPYDYVVIEQGEIESASNIELRCEVRSRGGGGGGSSSGGGGGGVTIIDVIPEGTRVSGPSVVEDPILDPQWGLEELAVRDIHDSAVAAVRAKFPNCTISSAKRIIPGKDQKDVPFDFQVVVVTNENQEVVAGVKLGTQLVKLDSSTLEQERVTQLIKVNGQKSLVAQAENTLKAAEIALKEYVQGTYEQEKKVIMAEVYVAEQALRSAQLAFDSAQRLAGKGLLNGLQLEGEQIAVQNARNTLDIAQSKLTVLNTLTKPKMETTFQSDIASAAAKVASEQSSLALEEDKLRDIDDQIRKCTIYAPADGEVVYANEYDSWRGSSQAEFVVVAGATVRERQAIIRLPNSNKMQVKATVNEARITLIRPGLPVTIRVDALKDQLVQGVVRSVNQYAEPASYSSGGIKKYATFIDIVDPPPALRSGMNSEVRIHVERKSDALQIPVQAVAEHKGKYFALVQSGDRYETREVNVGSSNDKVITIEGGLAENDAVVMNPRGMGNLLVLPDLPDPVPAGGVADIARTKPGEAIVRPVADAGGKGGGEKGKGKGKGRGNFTPAMLVERYLESDADKDGKLSKDEVAAMDERRKQGVADADKDSDGFLDRTELTVAAAAAAQRMREMKGGGGGEGRGGEGRGGPGGGGPQLGGGE